MNADRRRARLRFDQSGIAAVEFALVFPFLLLLYLGGFQICEAVSAYRKVTITARTVADLTTQYTTMGIADINTVLNASSQVMAPFSTTNLSIILTEYSTNASGVTSVTWSRALNATAAQQGSTVTLPANICQRGASVIYALVSYAYTPAVAYGATRTFTMSDQIYMAPRGVNSVACPSC